MVKAQKAIGSDEFIFRNPPCQMGADIYMASELDDKIDWGLEINNIPDHWKSRGKKIKLGVFDTGLPTHSDIQSAVVKYANFTNSHTAEDLQGHSTHVCGTAAARVDGKGVAGVAPECELYPCKVLGDDGSGAGSWIADGLDWGLEQDLDIFSLSLGGGRDPKIMAAVHRVLAAGKIIICAAGNSGRSQDGRSTVGWPAKDPAVPSIGSYNKQGNLSDFSSRGTEVTIAFPGEDILSCWLNNGYRRISGTSMATPFCSGLTANLLGDQRLAIEQGRTPQSPVNSTEELMARLKSVALDRGPQGFDKGWGWGVVDVDKFLKVTADSDNVDEPGDDKTSFLFGLIQAETLEHDGRKGLFISVPS
jgi:subtilisin family serine protease